MNFLAIDMDYRNNTRMLQVGFFLTGMMKLQVENA